jgi:hypothetical protein
MKKILFLLVGLFVVSSLPARRVNPDRAEKVAKRYAEHIHKHRAKNTVQVRHHKNKKRTRVAESASYYIFNVNEDQRRGFVIVSGSDAAAPVLGYSDKGSIDESNMPPGLVHLLSVYQKEIEDVEANGNRNRSSANLLFGSAWEEYEAGTLPDIDGSLGPLIPTQWGQGDGDSAVARRSYNKFCPWDSDTTVSITGCVATAMAQVMNYYKYPARGKGTTSPYVSKTNKFNMPAISLNVDYNWSNMPADSASLDSMSGLTSPDNRVALLMYHCGASVGADYASGGTGANLAKAADAFKNCFCYASAESVSPPPTVQEYENLLRRQIDLRRPVLVGDVDHAFICDGYHNLGAYGLFHFNMGWSGLSDGWYVVSAVGVDDDAPTDPDDDRYPLEDTTHLVSKRANRVRDLVINIVPDDCGCSR